MGFDTLSSHFPLSTVRATPPFVFEMCAAGFLILLTLIACEASNAENATKVLRQLCEEITSQSRPENRNLIFVFTLVTTADFETSFNYLWSLPRAQVYLSRKYIPLRADFREIIISWERDYQPSLRAMTENWDIYKACGLRDCKHVINVLDNFHLDQRVLIQVRELKTYEWHYNPPWKVRRIIDGHLGETHYYHRYRATLVVLRMQNKDTVHSSVVIRRSGRVVGGTIMPLKVEELGSSYARRIFDPVKDIANLSHDLDLGFTVLSFRGTTRGQRIGLSSCENVSPIVPRWRCHLAPE